MRRLAAVDLGTNAALLSVVEEAEGRLRVLEERCEIPRLGQGLDKAGAIDPEAATRALAVLAEFGAVVRQYGAHVRAVGTQALREAHDAESFVRRAEEALGASLEIIDGRREAELAFRAAIESFPEARGRAVVLDVGGGSTEVIRGEGGRIVGLVSYPMGSVRLTERHLLHDPSPDAEVRAAKEAVQTAFAAEGAAANSTIVGIAGTVTTLASVALGLDRYDAERVHGSRLSLREIERQADLYRAIALPERARVRGMDPRRADVIFGGALVVAGLCARLGANELVVSDRGVRWGLLCEMLG